MPQANLGIIAGSGLLPSEIAKLHTAKGGQAFIAGLAGNYEPDLLDAYAHKVFNLGQAGAIIAYFKENNVSEVILIGGITRPELLSIAVDFTGSKLLARLLKNKFIGDDNALKTIAEFIEESGLRVVSPKQYMHSNNDIITTELKPSHKQQQDINYGIEVLRSLSPYDVGQAVIVEDGYVLAIEAAEGTDNLIKRSKSLKKSSKQGGILVKMPKQSQDMRLDLPTIGPTTILLLAEYSFAGIAIDANNVLVVQPDRVKQLAKQHGLFLCAI